MRETNTAQNHNIKYLEVRTSLHNLLEYSDKFVKTKLAIYFSIQ